MDIGVILAFFMPLTPYTCLVSLVRQRANSPLWMTDSALRAISDSFNSLIQGTHAFNIAWNVVQKDPDTQVGTWIFSELLGRFST